MSNDVVFRRIGGRIVPIKRKLDQASKPSRNEFKTAFKAPTKKDIAPAVIVGTGAYGYFKAKGNQESSSI